MSVSRGLRAHARGVVSIAVALAAFAFVVRVVPFRERCAEPGAPSTKLAIERDDDGCTLRGPEPPRHLSKRACEALACEPGLTSTMARAKPLTLVALLAVYLAATFAWAVRWFLLVRLGGLQLSVVRVWRVTLEAQAGGILLPGGVGGDALRVGAAVGHGAPPSVVFASVVLDRVIGLITLAGTAAAISLSVTGLAPGNGATTLALAAFPVAFVLGLALVRAIGRSAWLQDRLASPPARARGLVSFARPAIEYILSAGALRAIGSALLASFVVSLLQLGVVRGIIAALGVVPVAEGWVYLGTAMTFMIAAVPALPGAWGTADAAFVFFLARAGIQSETAFAVSLLYRSLWYLSGMIGACLHLARATVTTAAARTTPAPRD